MRFPRRVYVIHGDEPLLALEAADAIRGKARAEGFTKRPRWPMIIFRTPKGWTGPKVVDGLIQQRKSGEC